MEFVISVRAGYNVDHLTKDIESVSSKLKVVKPHTPKYYLRVTTRSHALAKMVAMEFANLGVSFDFWSAE